MTEYDKLKLKFKVLMGEFAAVPAPIEQYVDVMEEVSGEVESILDAAREDVIRKESKSVVEHPGRL